MYSYFKIFENNFADRHIYLFAYFPAYLCGRMNLEVLLNFYKNDPRCFQIADRITLPEKQLLHLKGLHGSASQFILAAVFNQPAAAQLNHLIILRDAEEAAYFPQLQNTMRLQKHSKSRFAS